MFIIGLTGGLATGKSTVLNIFKENGIAVIDADEVARQVIEPRTKAWYQLVEEFGEGILLPDGKVNREVLGAIIFDDIEKRKRLNAITHPRIQSTMIKMAISYFLNGYNYIVMELPLLFETGRMMHFMHKIITVSCNDDQQLERLCKRNVFTQDVAKKRIGSQMPLADKVAESHFVIDNSGTFQETRKQTECIIRVLNTYRIHWFIRAAVLLSVIGLSYMCSYLYMVFWDK